ncbi:hypothetical protein SAMN05216232_2366 [Virgibacillus subterraneus]|uniref:Uncharacterized protein n=1 Tax=Virgibacillus subterraneus TaxID=621109 RepID=A0A1H9FX96_9BACI|nr:hypothetical protein [Virgibacillus subterraneus]SEQ42464.1 hypothetical protein SAMN05216232_2366 [Virgibacillus subterraneus]
MKQAIYGLMLYVFLILPPVANLLESIMIVHMHMQMPLLVISGFLMARFFQMKFPGFFEKWNGNGVPGILLFIVIWSYWMIPRSMDEAVTIQMVEVFKFISLPFLAGIPLRDSWIKLGKIGRNITYVFFVIMFGLMAWLYIGADSQICNNYLEVEQKTLGWGSLAFAAFLLIYVLQLLFIDQSEFE